MKGRRGDPIAADAGPRPGRPGGWRTIRERILVLVAGALLVPGSDAQEEGARKEVPRRGAPNAADRELRYLEVQVPIDAPPEVWGGPPGFDWMLQQIGVFERAEPGESVELMALRLGRDVTRLRHTSGFARGHLFETDELVCVERHHLLFPDEDLEFVADLHGSDVGTLRALNGLAHDERPAPWTELRVPARYEAATSPDGQAYRKLKAFFGDIDGVLDEQWPLNVRNLRLVRHRVEEGDTWASIAKAHRVTVEDLRSGHRFRGEWERWQEDQLADSEPPPAPRDSTRLVVGERIAVATRVRRKGEGTLFELVLALEYLCGDLQKVLELNELGSPEDLTGLDRITLPLSSVSLQFAIMFGADEVERLRELGYLGDDDGA